MADVHITAVKVDLDRATTRYVEKRIGSLAAHVPKKARMNADVTLKKVDRAHGNKYEVTAIVSIDSLKITAVDSTLNVLAAVDIVYVKLLAQIKDLRYNLS